jgi:hypothetical protein
VATRKQVLGMQAVDRVPFVGYHMPFPSAGFVEAVDGGFRYVPVRCQIRLSAGRMLWRLRNSIIAFGGERRRMPPGDLVAKLALEDG